MYTTNNHLYTSVVDNQDQALCHLFFHCCLEDGQFTDAEMEDLSAKLVELGLQPKLKIKEELFGYRSYRSDISIDEEPAYLEFLVRLLNPVNELALYSYCLELCLSDPSLDPREEALMGKLATILEIGDEEEGVIRKLMAQRKAVSLNKIF